MDVKSLPQQMSMFYLLFSSMPLFILALKDPVQTSSGPIVGTAFQYKCENIQAYLGIPYAEPPLGELRFKKTVPKKNWSKPLQATKFPSACPQDYEPYYPWYDTMPNQSEDCLYLNVWVPPNTTKDSKKAVMLWIYTGIFSYGSNRLPVYDGQVLAAEGDVVVVTINYRLGILGFLSTRTDEAPGNMGFYDMLEALKWVKCNIGAFGGDRDRITIFGHSAGGISGGLMCLSPLAKGLFQRAILQTGSPAYLYMDNTEGNTVLAQKVAKAVGCASDVNNIVINPIGVIQCLRTKAPKELVELSDKFTEGLVRFFSIVGDEFLPTDPRALLLTGNFNDVEVMVGHAQDEGSFMLASTELETFGAFGQNNPQVNKTFGAKCIRKYFKDLPNNKLIVRYYFKGLKEDDFESIRRQAYHSMGDFMFTCPDTYFAECYAKRGRNVYAYYFNHIPSVTPWARWMGSVHFDEVAFVYGRPLDHQSSYTSAERCLSRRLIRSWTNFAKMGVPCKNWQKYSRSDPYFKVFNISNRTSYLESHKKNCEFFRPIIGFL